MTRYQPDFFNMLRNHLSM